MFYSIDNAYKTESAQFRLVKIDTTLPSTSISLSGTLGNNGIYTSDVVVTLTCDDSPSGCANTKHCRDTTDTCPPTEIYSTPFTITTDGNYFVRASSTDNAGNADAVKSQPVAIDKTKPDTTIASGPSGTKGGFPAEFTEDAETVNSTGEADRS